MNKLTEVLCLLGKYALTGALGDLGGCFVFR